MGSARGARVLLEASRIREVGMEQGREGRATRRACLQQRSFPSPHSPPLTGRNSVPKGNLPGCGQGSSH